MFLLRGCGRATAQHLNVEGNQQNVRVKHLTSGRPCVSEEFGFIHYEIGRQLGTLTVGQWHERVVVVDEAVARGNVLRSDRQHGHVQTQVLNLCGQNTFWSTYNGQMESNDAKHLS